MSLRQKSFKAVAEDIRASYGNRYDDISVEQSNEPLKPNSEKVLHYTEEEKEKMFAENYKLIYHVANKYVIRGGIERDELYHSGLLGMVKALNTYDKNLGQARFSTYAIRCITNEILYFMRRERKHREDDNGNYLHHLEDTLKTDESGREFEKGDTIEDLSLPNPNENIFNNELNEAIMDLLKRTLNESEMFILIRRHGLDTSGKTLTQREIADILDMSQANVSKLQQNAEKKLYKYLVGVTGNKDLTIDEARDEISGLSLRRKTALSHLQRRTVE